MSEHTKAELGLAPRVAEIMGFDLVKESHEKDGITWVDTMALPSIGNCVGWLRERGKIIHLDYSTKMDGRIVMLTPDVIEVDGWLFMRRPRVALYRCVVAVGEGK